MMDGNLSVLVSIVSMLNLPNKCSKIYVYGSVTVSKTRITTCSSVFVVDQILDYCT